MSSTTLQINLNALQSGSSPDLLTATHGDNTASIGGQWDGIQNRFTPTGYSGKNFPQNITTGPITLSTLDGKTQKTVAQWFSELYLYSGRVTFDEDFPDLAKKLS